MDLDPLSRFRLDGRVAMVTGASSGLGRRMAHVLAGAGATVAVVARRADRLAELVDAIPGEAVAVPADLADPEACGAAVADVVDRCGRIDVLVNNAGLSTNALRVEDETLHDLRAVLDVNLVAPYVLSRAAADAMRAAGHGGSIVNVASILGLVGAAGTPTTYAASKAALVGLTRQLAAQWARHGIRVNALAPAYFRTEMTDDRFDDPRFREWITVKSPMRRTGEEHELDGPLLLLASDAGSYMTGQVVAVDGGWTAV